MPDSASRIADRITPWMEAAIERHGQGEQVVWEVSMVLAPDGLPVVIVSVWLHSGVVGSALPLVITIGNPMLLNAEEIDRAVAGALEEIRRRRSAFLAQQQAQQQAAHDAQSNGHHEAPPQGLVLPGSSLPPV